MSSSSPLPSKRRKVSTATTATADIEKNDNIKSLLSTLFDPHGTKQKSKKRKVDATNLIVHTPSQSTVETAQLKPVTTEEKRGSRQYMKWEDRFNQAKQYYSSNGELISGMSTLCIVFIFITFANHMYTNKSYYYLSFITELPKELYKWIAQQRCAYRKNKLRNDRLIQLQSFQNSLLLGNKDRVFKCYRSYTQQRMAEYRVAEQLTQGQESQYKEWQKKVWPNNTEEATSIARGGGNAATATENTSPTSSMDAALLSASITVDNNNKEEEKEEGHGWW